MAYIVNKSDNTVVATVSDGTIDTTSTSIAIPGKGFNNYGEILAENWIKMLENFANTNPPSNPLRGQLWYNPQTKSINVNLSDTPSSPNWLTIAKTIVSGTEPSNFQEGTTWYDTQNNTMNLSLSDNPSSPDWVTIGKPIVSGTEFVNIEIDGDNGSHPVIVWLVNNEPIGLWSDTSNENYTTSSSINLDNFPAEIEKGLNLTETSVFHGTQSSASYSDLAERYKADEKIETGSVVKIGGNEEVSKTTTYADEEVFGIVSTNPAFKMNSGAGSDETHPYIALSGRVPCKVVGPVKKGQRLVSSDEPGVAEAIDNKDLNGNYFAVFGRSLENNNTKEIKIVEVVVGVK